MNAYRSMAWTGAVALVAAGFLAAPRATKADDANSVRVIELLANARTMAVQAKNDAAAIEAFNQLDVQWEAHAASVAQMKEHVVAMNEEVAELKAVQNAAEPWERSVIERIEPYMAELAADNEAVLDEFDAHPSLFGTPAATAYLKANVSSATYLSALVVNFLENGTLRQMMQD